MPVGTAYVRCQHKNALPRAFGPRATDAAPENDDFCAACGHDFLAGEYTTLIPLGPAEDEEEREKARDGRVYNAIAIEVHYVCATGFEEPPAYQEITMERPARVQPGDDEEDA